MSKVTLSTFASLVSDASATTTLNENFSEITDAFDNTLSLDGTLPNAMGANLDMNSHRIQNLPLAVGDTEPVRLREFNQAAFGGGGGGGDGGVPAGGLGNQVLYKLSAADFASGWIGIEDLPITATDAITSRVLGDYLADNVNVANYGAVAGGSGPANVIAFQAAIDVTPNLANHFQTVDIPHGTYAGDFSTLDYGLRSILFKHMGEVIFSGTAPSKCNTAFEANIQNAVRRPTFQGFWQYYRSFEDGDNAPNASNVLIKEDDIRTVNNPQNHSVWQIDHNISSTDQEQIRSFVIDTDINSTTSDTVVGLYINLARNVGTNDPLLNSPTINNLTMHDNTGRASSVSIGALTCFEIQVSASGPDDGLSGDGYRNGLVFNTRELEASVDGFQTVNSAMRVKNNATTGPGGGGGGIGGGTWRYGLQFDIDSTAGAGGLQTGILIPYARDYCIDIGGAEAVPTGAHIRIKGLNNTDPGVFKLGSGTSANNTVTGQLIFIGENGADTEIGYSSIHGKTVDNTVASEDGKLILNTMIAGLETPELTMANGVMIGTATGTFKGAGTLNLQTSLFVAGTKVLGTQGAAVADATDAPSVILRLNELLARSRAHGLIAT